MPVVKMPNGDLVEFPDDMPREQIKAQILKWFPDAAKGAAEKPAAKEAAEPQESTLQWAGRQALDFGKGAAQRIGSTIANLGEMLPGGNLPGLPERAVKAREQAKQELKEFTDAPSQSWAQSAGQVTGEVAPWFIPGPGIVGKVGEAAGRGLTSLLPRVAPAVRQASGRFAANPAYAARQALQTKLGGVGSTLGDVVERAGMGATIGAAQEDPESRERGAIAGAIGAGALPFGLGVLSKPLSGLTGHLARTAAGTGAGWVLQQEGVNPYEAYALGLGGAYSPLGKIARGAGAWPMRAATAVGSKFPPLTGAATAGAARSFGESRQDAE
jgi:hypothetical protein